MLIAMISGFGRVVQFDDSIPPGEFTTSPAVQPLWDTFANEDIEESAKHEKSIDSESLKRSDSEPSGVKLYGVSLFSRHERPCIVSNTECN